MQTLSAGFSAEHSSTLEVDGHRKAIEEDIRSSIIEINLMWLPFHIKTH